VATCFEVGGGGLAVNPATPFPGPLRSASTSNPVAFVSGDTMSKRSGDGGATRLTCWRLKAEGQFGRGKQGQSSRRRSKHWLVVIQDRIGKTEDFAWTAQLMLQRACFFRARLRRTKHRRAITFERKQSRGFT
jgi:hypothetical protein